jgi:isoleucyl-tRNA synthetase
MHVFDCWFESSSMPYGQVGVTGRFICSCLKHSQQQHLAGQTTVLTMIADGSVMLRLLLLQLHYPFENKELFEANFPADFVAEGLDQTRGW